ncbi:MAG: hypothetical protein IPL59_18250 [Candidatus Competibacteraceae bacterium]|nr:hypothetical protein [Candidatus Competibacteraceae bacterium]
MITPLLAVQVTSTKSGISSVPWRIKRAWTNVGCGGFGIGSRDFTLTLAAGLVWPLMRWLTLIVMTWVEPSPGKPEIGIFRIAGAIVPGFC